jgi:hypothetical protein
MRRDDTARYFSQNILLRINLQWNKQDWAVAGSKTDLLLASITGYVSDEFIMWWERSGRMFVSDVTDIRICRCLYSLVFGNKASHDLTLRVFHSLIIAVLSSLGFRSSRKRRCVTGWSVPPFEGTPCFHPQGFLIHRTSELKTFEHEGNTFLRTIGNQLSNDATSHPWRAECTITPPWNLKNP